jgi:Tol biopolymer transport system component
MPTSTPTGSSRPATSATTSPVTTEPPATTPPPTEPPPTEPPLGPSLTLRDLHATFAYAVCEAGQCDVHVVDANGVDRNVTRTPETGTEEHQPVFSPDGRRVTFRCTHQPGAEIPNNSNDDICIADVDGRHRRNLTDNELSDYSSWWSPDGRWIAFASGRGEGPDNPNDIYVMAPDGTQIRRITATVGIDEYPVWSPDGTRIAYSCSANRIHPTGVGDFEACVIDADGTDRARITDTPGICHPLAWSPDSTPLAVGCDPDGNGSLLDDVYLLPVAAGGTAAAGELRRLTWEGGFGARFTPDGDALIYKDRDGRLNRLALDRSSRSPIEAPHFEADWDIHFLGA